MYPKRESLRARGDELPSMGCVLRMMRAVMVKKSGTASCDTVMSQLRDV